MALAAPPERLVPYEAVFEGDWRQFNTAVSARMAIFEGGVDAFAASNGLRLHFVGAGLRPRKPTAIFARGPQAILSAYDTGTAPSPIFAEYRAIPGRWHRTTSPIPFDAALRIMVRFENVRVIEDGTWFSTPWHLSATRSTSNAHGSGKVFLLAGDRVNGRSPPVQLAGPGRIPLRISGQGDSSYVINASVDVSVVN
jgi:hypothetical protein